MQMVRQVLHRVAVSSPVSEARRRIIRPRPVGEPWEHRTRDRGASRLCLLKAEPCQSNAAARIKLPLYPLSPFFLKAEAVCFLYALPEPFNQLCYDILPRGSFGDIHNEVLCDFVSTYLPAMFAVH